ncbi:MAG TPA: M48 family metallopeptidase [Candidatus Krumholzibacteria bacterium]|nr:M48 family metallopeptidase [Candidatus Krumholzibacteria bacterium]
MMWELIAANKRKSMMLFIGMATLLVLLGFFIGEATMGQGGGQIGIIIAIAVWVIMSAASVFGGPDLVLRMSHAKPVTRDVHPQLFNVVEEMKIAGQLPAMPKIYIIDEKAPNAFATGLRPEDSSIAVTAGLLTRLNRDELQGVIAHETSHIMNRDVQFLTLASIMLGSIVLVSEIFLRGMWYSGGSGGKRYRSGKKSGGGGSNVPFIVIAIVLAILGPLFARLLYLSISRKREYLADACAARLTRYPEGLAGALEKISQSQLPLEVANKVNAPMFIAAPLQEGQKVAASGWGATHPPIEKRIAVLRAMSEGAGYLSYQHAFARIEGKPAMLLPKSAIQQDERVAVRDPDPDVVREESQRQKTRTVMDLMRAVNGFAFLMCACGLKIKVPPDYADPAIKCPRCGRENEIPKATVSDFAEVAAAVGAVVGAGAVAGASAGEVPFAKPVAEVTGPDAPLEYSRRTRGDWESFSCSCGHLLQLSPIFSASQMKCPNCGRITRIV